LYYIQQLSKISKSLSFKIISYLLSALHRKLPRWIFPPHILFAQHIGSSLCKYWLLIILYAQLSDRWHFSRVLMDPCVNRNEWDHNFFAARKSQQWTDLREANFSALGKAVCERQIIMACQYNRYYHRPLVIAGGKNVECVWSHGFASMWIILNHGRSPP
jgi:hypothetical protein